MQPKTVTILVPVLMIIASAAELLANGCEARFAPLNGQIVSDEGFDNGDTITYSCNPGFDLAGASSALCQSDDM